MNKTASALSSDLKRGQLRALIEAGKGGKRPLGLYLSLESPALIEIAALCGYEWVIVNLEHSMISDRDQVFAMARAAEVMGLPFFVKLECWDPIQAEQYLDVGASGICVPHVESAKDLRAMIKETRFPPAGSRGYCSVSRASRYGIEWVTGEFQDYKSYWALQHESLIIPFIESAEGLSELDAMLEIEEVPWIVLGSADLSLSLSTDGSQNMAATAAAHKAVGEKVAAKGKLLSIYHHAIPFANLDGSPQDRSPQKFADRLVLDQNSMPFVPDVWAFGLGLHDARRTRDLSVKR